MKKFVIAFSSFLTLALLVVAHAEADSWSTCGPQDSQGSMQSFNGEPAKDQAFVFVANGNAYEVLKGTPAFHYVSDKRLRNPERFLGMGGALAARGYRPTDILVVQRKLGPAESALPGYQGPMSVVPQPAATTYSNSAGEQIFWSWDDGDDSTWEGSQYVERYSDGAWASYDGQLDISNTDGTALWGIRTGGGGGVNQEHQVLSPSRSPRVDLRFATLDRIPAYSRGGVVPASLDEDFRTWAICITGGCMGCAGGCLFTGPAYPVCYGSCCFGVSIACAFDYYFG